MKIGIFDPYLDTLGGGERYMLTIAECLSGKNKVTVFWDDSSIIQKAEEKFGLNLKKVTTAKNVFKKETHKIVRFFTTLKYDRIIILSDGSVPILAAKKTYIHFQAPLREENIKKSTKARLSATKEIIVNSHYTKKYIDNAFSKNSAVIYPPVEVEKFTKKLKKENTILTVGRYSKLHKRDFKKHGEMIKAFKEMVDNGLKNWKLNMIISHLPKDKEKVEDLIESAKKYPIQIHTHTSNEEIIKMYGSAKIYWHAAGLGEDLEKNPDLAEHFGIAPVEAMAAGAVPIVYNAGGLKEIVENGDVGLLFENIKELQEKTLEIISDENLRKKFVTKARKEAQLYTKKRFCEEITTLLQ